MATSHRVWCSIPLWTNSWTSLATSRKSKPRTPPWASAKSSPQVPQPLSNGYFARHGSAHTHTAFHLSLAANFRQPRKWLSALYDLAVPVAPIAAVACPPARRCHNRLICAVVTADGWFPRKADYDEVKEWRINEPIEQVKTGIGGIFTQINVSKKAIKV